jgi:ABC-2 type transport system permease protein
VRTALAIARKDLRQRIRDRSAIVVGVIAPVVIAGLMSLAFNGRGDDADPSTIKHLALLTPNGWAIRGFTDLATIGGGFGTIVEPVVAILVFSAVVGAVALSLARRAVTT